MKNLEKSNPFAVTIRQTAAGKISTLVAETGISAKDNISCGGSVLLANYVYTAKGTYDMHYTIVAPDGTIESYKENDGILPTLFLSPENVNYISLVPYHPDKEQEISIPVLDRTNIELPKGNRPFTGNFIGTSGQYAIFYDVDIWSDTKPDKLLAIEFKDGLIKKKHNIKVPLPRDNKIFINDGIHLLAKDGNNWLHRQIDEKGNIVQQRTITSAREYFMQIISLSFDQDSWLLAQEEDTSIIVEKINPNGEATVIRLWNLEDEIYNTWQPERISANSYLVRFNTEFGNGWFIIEQDKLIELFYDKEVKGYKNLLTGEVIDMGEENLILSGGNKTSENAYAIVFYDKPGEEKENKLVVLNRQVK